MMDIRPIHTKADHKAALKLVSRLVDLDPPRGTPDGDMLEIMSTLVEAYEAKHFPIKPANRSRRSSSAWTSKGWRHATSSR
jgi:HTH-type transcriptional regulator/antitoxin HigA